MFFFYFFFFIYTATTEIYTLSLHDALPISLAALHAAELPVHGVVLIGDQNRENRETIERFGHVRSEEHTSELQSHSDLVCRLLLEKKKNRTSVKIAHAHTVLDSMARTHKQP